MQIPACRPSSQSVGQLAFFVILEAGSGSRAVVRIRAIRCRSRAQPDETWSVTFRCLLRVLSPLHEYDCRTIRR